MESFANDDTYSNHLFSAFYSFASNTFYPWLIGWIV